MKNNSIAFVTSILLTTFYHSLFLSIQYAVGVDEYSRADFPAQFVFGSGTSAYQVSFTIYLSFYSWLIHASTTNSIFAADFIQF